MSYAINAIASRISGKYLAQLGLVCAAQFAAGKIGDALHTVSNGGVGPVWPASGIALAALLLWGYSVWPGVAAGAFLLALLSPLSLWAALLYAAGTTLAAALGTFLLCRFVKFSSSLSRLRDALGLIILGAFVSSVVSASIGASILYESLRSWSGLGSAWLVYWLGDSTGVLLVAPIVLTLTNVLRTRDRNRILELAVLLGLLALGSFVVLGDLPLIPVKLHFLTFAVLPFIMWAAIRLGVGATALSIFVVSTVATIETAFGSGPFTINTPLTNALLLDTFFGVISITGLVLAAVVAERENVERERELVMRKQAEAEARLEAIRESEQRFCLVANTAPVLIWMSGVDMICNYVNKAWLDFRGAPLEEEVGDGWMKGVYPGDLERLLDIQGKAVEQRECYQVEYRMQRRDGEYRWILQSSVPRFNSDLSFAGYIASALDITERKLAEEDKERFLSVFDCSAVGMAIVAYDGRFISVNSALCEILGYSEQELLATNFQSLTHPDDLDTDLSYTQKVFAGQLRVYHNEKRYIHKQGHVVWVTLTASAVPDASGKVSYGIAQVQDITANKNAEAALRQDQAELQSLAGRLITIQEEERKRIARDLHDDLSQRLALVTVDLDMLRQSLPGDLEAARELERMRREIGELVIDVRRLSHNEHHPQLALGLQHGVTSFCNDFSKHHGIAAKLVHEGDLKRIPETVCFTLFRVLQEAMNNVAKHSGAERVTVTLGVHGDQAVLRVADEGRGFEVGSDRGLGLISMRERLRLVGGTMRVNSSPKEGTDVEAVVPIPTSGGAQTRSA